MSGEVVQQYADAWVAGDLATMLDLYADDFVLHYFGASPLAGDHVGKPAALQALAQATARSHRQLIEVIDVLVGRESTALVVRERIGEAPGREVQRVLRYRTNSTQLVECWLFDEDQRLVDELWSTVEV